LGNLWRERGIWPENELLARLMAVRWVKWERERGMVPVKQLLERSRTERFLKAEKSGKEPEKLLN